MSPIFVGLFFIFSEIGVKNNIRHYQFLDWWGIINKNPKSGKGVGGVGSSNLGWGIIKFGVRGRKLNRSCVYYSKEDCLTQCSSTWIILFFIPWDILKQLKDPLKNSFFRYLHKCKISNDELIWNILYLSLVVLFRTFITKNLKLFSYERLCTTRNVHSYRNRNCIPSCALIDSYNNY